MNSMEPTKLMVTVPLEAQVALFFQVNDVGHLSKVSLLLSVHCSLQLSQWSSYAQLLEQPLTSARLLLAVQQFTW